MIYFLTALYHEAKDIIDHYKMKRIMEASKFQVFRGENQLLVISGPGGVKAVAAATYMLTGFGFDENDIFVNAGICGAQKGQARVGEVFLCNKLIDNFTKRAYYPDMLFRHPFKEGTLESFPGVIDANTAQNTQADIADLEGAFAYQAASIFLRQENIHIIKIVSDVLNPASVTPKSIEALMSVKMSKVYSWLGEIDELKLNIENALTHEEIKALDLLSGNISLTASMRAELQKLVKQYKIRNGHVLDILNDYMNIECNIKNEGKTVYGEVRKKLMEL